MTEDQTTAVRHHHGPHAHPSLWRAVKDSVLGDPHRDFTEGSIARAITLLAIPMVLEMLMESLFAVVDVFWVAKLGSNAVATVGFTESLLTLLYAVAMGLSISAAATVARRVGEKHPSAAADVAIQSVLLGVITAVILGLAGGFFAPQLLRLMGASPEVVATGGNYARAIYGGSGTVLLLFLINAVFRGAGDAALSMRVLWTANIINMLLNPCLIFGWGPFPRLGVTGSGVGTTIGRGVGVLLQLWYLFSGRSRVTLTWSQFRILPDLMFRLIRLSLGGMLQNLIGMASWILLVRIIAGFGSAAVAGYTLAVRIMIFSLLPSWGMANAAATMVGQNLGAKKPQRAQQAVWRAGIYNMVFLGLVALVFVTFAEGLVGLFTRDPQVVPIAAGALRAVSYGYLFYGWGMVLVQAFNGAGDTITPTILNLICFWAWQLPLAWFFAFPLGFKTRGIFMAIAVAYSTFATAAFFMFRRGKWKLQKV
jgi:putative MATE family efflux protein